MYNSKNYKAMADKSAEKERLFNEWFTASYDRCKHSINSPFHSKKCDITFVIKVKKLNCYVTSMDHGRF